MKKFIVFILILCCLVSTGFIKYKGNSSIFALDGITKVCLVEEEKLDGVESVPCGNYFFNFCSLELAKEKYNQLRTNGVQLYFDNVSVESLCRELKCEIVDKTQIDDLTVLQCYTPYFQKCVYIQNKKVNVQVAATSEGVIAGFPMILTGY